MGFIDSYKRLEKLCSELLDSDRSISAYIDEMLNITDGAFHVKDWDRDLKKIKHYRWVRNRIVHEPGCTELNMCTAEDEKWIDDFYSRIINRTDPLALYRKATTKKPSTAVSCQSLSEAFDDIDNEDDYTCISRRRIALALTSLAITAAILFIIFYIKSA